MAASSGPLAGDLSGASGPKGPIPTLCGDARHYVRKPWLAVYKRLRPSDAVSGLDVSVIEGSVNIEAVFWANPFLDGGQPARQRHRAWAKFHPFFRWWRAKTGRPAAWRVYESLALPNGLTQHDE